MVPDQFHEFFIASAGIAGALIGLLFVAISVAPERVTGLEAIREHQVRAAAALTAFTNALTVSLFALIAGIHLGWSVLVIATVGLLFVLSSLVALLRTGPSLRIARRDLSSMIGLAVLFGVQLLEGLRLIHHESAPGPTRGVCVIVVVCFLVGIARAWELIGGPSIRLWSEVGAALRGRHDPNE